MTGCFEEIISSGQAILDKISLNGPSINPRVIEETDAGPGVGVSNHQVHYRAVEKVQFEKLDCYLHIHSSGLWVTVRTL